MSGGEDTEIENAWNSGCAVLIPEKSKEQCKNTHKIFKKLCEERNKSIMKKVVLVY